MNKIKLAIVGCGGMGHRHLRGLAELTQAGLSPFELIGAQEAEEHFGTRPTIVANLAELTQLGVEAVDITTTPTYHHTLASKALELGWHTMIEKPVGLTVRACNLIRAATQQSGKIVSVAENYRRDPATRC